MTRYEYNYALQDLLDLPPETVSEDGFKNSSEMLYLTAMQFDYYRKAGRQALKTATVKGERPPVTYYSIDMRDVTDGMEPDYAKLLKKALGNPEPKPDKKVPKPGNEDKSRPSLLQGAKREFEMRPGAVHFKFLGPDKGSFEFLDTEKGLHTDRGRRVLHEAADAPAEAPPPAQQTNTWWRSLSRMPPPWFDRNSVTSYY